MLYMIFAFKKITYFLHLKKNTYFLYNKLDKIMIDLLVYRDNEKQNYN